MSRGKARVRAVAFVLGLAVVLSGFAVLITVHQADARSVTVASSGSFAVTATSSFSFDPSTLEQVPAGSNVSVSFTDASSVPHTFTIIGRQGWVIPSSISPSDFNNLVFGRTPAPVYNINISSTGTISGSFTSPAPGWYEFVCTEPGHFAAGMYGFIGFGMNLPSNLTVSSGTPGPGAALFIIIGTIVSLVVIALVLGFVVGRRKGSMHEMPPERLGYPEPEAPLASPVEPERPA